MQIKLDGCSFERACHSAKARSSWVSMSERCAIIAVDSPCQRRSYWRSKGCVSLKLKGVSREWPGDTPEPTSTAGGRFFIACAIGTDTNCIVLLLGIPSSSHRCICINLNGWGLHENR